MKKRNIWLVGVKILFVVIVSIFFISKLSSNNLLKMENGEENFESTKEVEMTTLEKSINKDTEIVEETYAKIFMSNPEATRGTMVEVNVLLENNPGVLAMGIKLFYDERVLKLVNAENGDAFADTLTMSCSKELDSGCVFFWDGEEILPEQIFDGVFLRLEFMVAEDASLGKTELRLLNNEGNTINNDLQILDIPIEDGFIKIVE